MKKRGRGRENRGKEAAVFKKKVGAKILAAAPRRRFRRRTDSESDGRSGCGAGGEGERERGPPLIKHMED